jgi:glycosidase
MPKHPYRPRPFVTIKTPDWAKNAAIYQINTRQFTPEGTFRAAEKHLPRLKELGTDILWLMPVHEIGVKNRKGTLGSPYSVKDYYSVNPEFGTRDDLIQFINTAHDLGFYVILDWVANHTSWDNNLAEEHPEWYARDWKGDFRPTPWWDWTDIIDLDYSHEGLRKYMTDAMKFWVSEIGFDGFRADVAGFVPTDFWDNVRSELDQIKPVFMLAEWESRDLHAAAFDMTYAWSWWEIMTNIAQGKMKGLGKLFEYYSWKESAMPKEAIKMTFVTNHDKNAWEGTMFENFGDALEAVIALSVVGDGMPLIYNGQEVGNDKALEFFEKDPIVWQKELHPAGELYQRLIALMKRNRALWHGVWGGTMIRVPNSREQNVVSFVRRKENDKVFAVFNFSGISQTVTFRETLYHGKYEEFITGDIHKLNEDLELNVEPWSFKVFEKVKV